jgi:hypothetical protein
VRTSRKKRNKDNVRNFDLLLSPIPALQERLRALEAEIFSTGGPLEPRETALAALGAALATAHPDLKDMLLWAKQQGLRNEEIAHVTAVAAFLSMTQIGSTAISPASPEESKTAGCC